MNRRAKRQIRILAALALILYILILIYVCFFSEDYGRTISTSYRYNLVPFKEIKRFYIYRDQVGFVAFVLNLFGNVLAFMPFGYLVPVIKNKYRKVHQIIALTFCLSLTIETIQLVTKVGSFDVDDLMLNTFGGVIGFTVFSIMNYIRRRKFVKESI